MSSSDCASSGVLWHKAAVSKAIDALLIGDRVIIFIVIPPGFWSAKTAAHYYAVSLSMVYHLRGATPEYSIRSHRSGKKLPAGFSTAST